MKVLLVNGSPHQKGCTAAALSEVAKTLEANGVQTEMFWIGNQPIHQCIGCFACAKKGKCVFDDDPVNAFTKKAADFDGFVFGSPVYFAGMCGGMVNFMNRVFFSPTRGKTGPFFMKPAAAVVSARRAGTTAALDQMNHYFLHGQLPVVPSRYWNEVHGNMPEEVRQDEEGMQIMRVLGRNMAWMLKLIDNGRKAGIAAPEQEDTRIATNFIR
jgi:multimeric flavodoxin WrbA